MGNRKNEKLKRRWKEVKKIKEEEKTEEDARAKRRLV
jgi:hypothetical protein